MNTDNETPGLNTETRCLFALRYLHTGKLVSVWKTPVIFSSPAAARNYMDGLCHPVWQEWIEVVQVRLSGNQYFTKWTSEEPQ